ncbi:Protein of unknown function [Pyronema omphalodes CBS 100304]|uniref:Uncharacterized protein n=1 Tax=Pyronema omphalodes (strain CBS 100304) TaxID=1076935 RepID=U4L5J9_PYROM|nr:Protein of unknown function [Pyronema omphalodes CBS 100304]
MMEPRTAVRTIDLVRPVLNWAHQSFYNLDRPLRDCRHRRTVQSTGSSAQFDSTCDSRVLAALELLEVDRQVSLDQ